MKPMWWQRFVYMKPEDDGGSGGGGGDAAAAASAAAAAAASAGEGDKGDKGPDASKTLVDDGGDKGGEKGAAKADWPSDWREKVSKTDEKILARMQRYASPEAALNALIAAQNRISAGELKPVLGKNPTPEQVTEYRAALGIPETADKYDLGKEVEIKDTEKTFFDKIFGAAHKSNQTPEQVRETVKAYRDVQKEVAEAQFVKDEESFQAASDTLRAEWGEEYRRDINLINGLLDGSGSQKLKEQLLHSRLPDGTKFANSPEVMKMLLSVALVQNPTGVVVPGGGADQGTGIREEMAKIAKIRDTDRKAYNKDEKMQERERELIAAAQRMKLMDDRGNWKG